ncbi:hypothetical protein GCM10008985_37520 [Halococcus dombrowskii]|uniref:Uncharacterized protein n=1 Tax=Halococcus dombrowskii TaxID=179637 RepID=A0AAV3SMJ1_HALDO
MKESYSAVTSSPSYRSPTHHDERLRVVFAYSMTRLAGTVKRRVENSVTALVELEAALAVRERPKLS